MQVTLDISSSSLKIVSFNGGAVEKWGTASLAPGLVRDGHILQPQAVGEAITSLYKSLQIPKSKGAGVTATISGLSFVHRIVRLPRLKPALMTEAIIRAAKKEIPLPPEETYLSWQTIGGDKQEVELFLLGVPRNLIDALNQTLDSAGLRLLAFDLKSMALARVANRADALVVSFASDCFDIVLVTGGRPNILHTVIPRSEGVTLQDNVGKLVDEVARTVDFYNITHVASPVQATTPLLLAGDLADDPAAVQLIKENIDHPVEMLTASVKAPPQFPLAAYAGNVGLFLKSVPVPSSGKGVAPFRDINIDILAGRRRVQPHRTPTLSGIVPVLTIAAAVLLILLFVADGQARASRTGLKGQLDVVSRDLGLARARADNANDVTTTIRSLQTETDGLMLQQKQVLAKEVNTADLLKLTITDLPLQADLTAIEITPQQVTVEGRANSKSDVISYAETLSKDARFTDVRIARIDEVPAAGGTAPGMSFSIVISRKI